MDQAAFQKIVTQLQAAKTANGGQPLKYDAGTKSVMLGTGMGTASGSTSMDASGANLAPKIDPKDPNAVFDSAFQGPVTGALKGVSDFLGTTQLGKAIMQNIYLHLTPDGQAVQDYVRQGKITPEQLQQILGGKVTSQQVIGSALQTGADVLTAGVGGGVMKTAAQMAGVSAISGVGNAIEGGAGPKDTAIAGAESGVAGGILGAGAGVLSATGKYAANELPTRLFGTIFKSSVDEVQNILEQGGQAALQKLDPELYNKLVAKGAISVGTDGKPIIDTSLAQKAVQKFSSATGKNLENIGQYSYAKLLQIEDKVQNVISKADPVTLEPKMLSGIQKVLIGALADIQKTPGASDVLSQTKPLEDMLGAVKEAINNGSNQLPADTALTLRRVLDGFRNVKSFMTDPTGLGQQVYKTTSDYLRGVVNKIPEMGSLMKDYKFFIDAAAPIVKKMSAEGNKQLFNLFDLLIVEEGGSKLAGGGGFGLGTALDGLFRFVNSSTGALRIGQLLNKVGQSPTLMGTSDAVGKFTQQAAINMIKGLFSSGPSGANNQ